MVSIQPNMQVHDELAALFSRNMTFQQPPPPEPVKQSEPQIVYSISQHYHHSSHLVQKNEEPTSQSQPQRPNSLPPPDSVPTAEHILATHGVDPTVLSPAQIELFKTTGDDGKRRLIEIWTISPPEHSGHADNHNLALNNTSLEQEEALARLRYERQQHEEQAAKQQAELLAQQQAWQGQQNQNESMSLDGTMVLTPFQGGDGRWITLASAPEPDQPAEPYMSSGYEELARREYAASTANQRPRDVYAHFGAAVGGPSCIKEKSYNQATDPVYRQVMENQYGAFQGMQGTCGMSMVDEMEVL